MPWRVREANCELRDAVVNFGTTELHNFISLFESRKLQHNEAESFYGTGQGVAV